MIDIILVSHGSLAAGMREAAEMILGGQENLFVLDLYPGDTLESFSVRLEQTIDQCRDQKNVLILSDLLNGTPHHAAMVMTLKKGASCIAGCNLPLVLEAVSMRDESSDVKELVNLLCETGRKGVVSSEELMRRS